MLTMYTKKKEDLSHDKYYQIGYKAHLNNLPRDLADDLVISDRANFLKGWDMAKQERLNKSPRTPRPSMEG